MRSRRDRPDISVPEENHSERYSACKTKIQMKSVCGVRGCTSEEQIAAAFSVESTEREADEDH